MKRMASAMLILGLSFSAQTAPAQWTPAKRLTWTSGYSFDPAIAVDSSHAVHIVWSDETPGNYEIYYKKSSDGGTTWSPAQRLTWTSGISSSPAIGIDSTKTIHITWHDTTPGYAEIYYRRSTDGGTTWSGAQRLTWTSGKSYNPALAIDSNNKIYIIWEDITPGNVEIYFRRSTDRGLNWGTVKRITWTPGDSYGPALSGDSNNIIHVVWKDDTPGNEEIYYLKSTDTGSTWSGAKRITWTSGSSGSPAIAVDSTDTIHVVWYIETSDGLEIYYRRSQDGGTTWSVPKRLTWTSGSSSMPAISVDSADTIHIVWQEVPAPGNDEIYYKKSEDGGKTWSSSQRLTWASGWSYYPAIAIDSTDTIHVVWRDDPSGNVEIYYKQGK